MKKDQNPTDPTSLTTAIKSLAGASTTDLIGIAPGEAFSAEEAGELGERFGPIKSLIVLAQRIVDPVQLVVFRSSSTHNSSQVSVTFFDALLKDACWRIVEILRDAGYAAAILRNQRYGAFDPRHNISYKKAAVLAGMGSVGKNQLLIHPEWGPWIRFKVVATDAELIADESVDFSPCEQCNCCVDTCPSGALAEDGYNRAACESFAPDGCGDKQLSPLGHFHSAHCLQACPVGIAPPHLKLSESSDATLQSREKKPVPGSCACVLHQGKLLLVKRATEPRKGTWGFPGGHIELGETMAEAAKREALEETDVEVEPGVLLGTYDRITRNGTGCVTHHAIIHYIRCSYVSGEPCAGSDAAVAKWVSQSELTDLPMHPVARKVAEDLFREA